MNKRKHFKSWLLGFIITLAGPSVVMADVAPLTRGQAVSLVVDYFDLEANNADFLENCRFDPGTCLFAFSARTNFKDLRTSPVILYPDVYPAYRHYDAINVASMLDLVSGYYMDENSPFRPEQPITRVEALKLVMGASGLLSWKEKFELNGSELSWLQLPLSEGRWWYGRYLATAADAGFMKVLSPEEAEQYLEEADLLKIMDNANKMVASRQNTSRVDNNGQAPKEADTSGNSAI